MGEYLKLLFVSPDRLPGGKAWGEACNGLVNNTAAWREAGCDVSHGMGLIQVVFLLIVYSYVLFVASGLISGGSELLLLVPSMRNMVGSIVLPILGAVPDGAIVLFSGLGKNAQEEVAVGVGALAGSTIMLLTLPWALSVFAGRVDIVHGEVQYSRPTRTDKGKWSKVSGNCNAWFSTGVEPKAHIKRSAMIMLGTAVSYLLIQLPAFYSPSHGIRGRGDEETVREAARLEHYWALGGFVVCAVCFVAYLWYQVHVAQTDEAVNDKIEAQQTLAIRNGVMAVSSVFYGDLKEATKLQETSETHLLAHNATDAQKRMVEVLRTFFKGYDLNKDDNIDIIELQLLLHDLGEKLSQEEMQELLKRIDTDNSGKITFKEFAEGLPSFLLERVEHRLPHGAAVISDAETLEEVDEDVEVPEDLVDVDPPTRIRVVTRRAFCQLALGTVIVLLFSDPMVEVLNDIGRRINVPSFYVSFLLAPLAANASEFLATYYYASKKTRKSITISFSTLLGAGVMNNTFCLGIFLMLVFARNLAWQFSAETISILFVEVCLFVFATRKQLTVFQGCIILALLPLSLGIVAGLEALGLD